MVSTTRSSRNVNLVPKLSTPSKDKKAEEEPQVLYETMKITQDDEIVIEPVTELDENSRKCNEHARIARAIAENPTSFRECTDEVFAKSVNQQHFLANPHLPNPNTTKAEHVAKLREVRDKEAMEDPVLTVVEAKLPPVGASTPVPKPAVAQGQTPSVQKAPATILLKQKLDNWLFFFHQPSADIDTQGPFCPIATALTTSTIKEQETQTQEFFNFISQQNTDAEILNAEKTPYTFLMHVPGTRSFKVCYGMGSGVSFGGLRGSTINDKALALSGDYQEGTKYPTIFTFPIYDMVNPTTVKSPTYKQLFALNTSFGTKKPSDNKLTFFKSNELTETAKLHHLAPIPAFLIKDHIDSCIDVFTIIDRLQCIQQTHPNFTNTHCALVYKHALNYCLNALVSRTKKETTVTFPVTHFMNDSDPDANAWKLQRLKQQFPTIFEAKPKATTKITPPQDPVTLQHTNTSDDDTTRLLKLYLTNQLQQQQQAGTKDEASEKFLGMCESEYDMLLQYCGIHDGDMEKLPKFWVKLAEKNRSKEGKKNEVRGALRNTQVTYKDAKIKITPTLLTMITTRAFEGETSSSKQEATKGLSPFILPPISNTDLDEIIALDHEITEATAISTSDIKKTKITLVEAETYEDMMRYLKEFANLLEVLFSKGCPLWRALHDAIEKLMDYTSEERAALHRVSCNAILWIVMRQARAFAAGDMPEPESANAAFTEMMLRINIRCQIEFGGLPATMKKRKADAINTGNTTTNNTNNNNTNNNNGNGNSNNSRTNNNSNNNIRYNNHQYNSHNTAPDFTDKGVQNQKLARAFSVIKNQNRSPPQVYRITSYCNITYSELFRKKGICTKAQLFGLCDRNCPHIHEKISDGEADSVIRKLKRAIDNPNDFKNRV